MTVPKPPSCSDAARDIMIADQTRETTIKTRTEVIAWKIRREYRVFTGSICIRVFNMRAGFPASSKLFATLLSPCLYSITFGGILLHRRLDEPLLTVAPPSSCRRSSSTP